MKYKSYRRLFCAYRIYRVVQAIAAMYDDGEIKTRGYTELTPKSSYLILTPAHIPIEVDSYLSNRHSLTIGEQILHNIDRCLPVVAKFGGMQSECH